ncbi:HEPACAM family member 2-like, partial [Tachysurus ichikawai]
SRILAVSKIIVSSSSDSLTLNCETGSGKFKQLQWFRNGFPLPDDQRFSLSDNNKTMVVSSLTSSDCGNYTCKVSDEHRTSAAHVIVSVFRNTSRHQLKSMANSGSDEFEDGTK